MKIFITHTFKGIENKLEIEELCQIVRDSGWQDYSFVRDAENYSKDLFKNETDLMLAAKKEISNCDALLIDITDPSLGKGIEAGIAYSLGKKIIVIIKKGSEPRRTAFGIADLIVEYDDIKDIKSPLTKYFLKLKK